MEGDPVERVALYDAAIKTVRFYLPPPNRQLLRENLLSNYLELASKDLRNLESSINSYKFTGLAINFNLELLQAIKLKSPYNLINYRGLYLCINFVEAVRLGDEYQRCRESILRYVEELEAVVMEFGGNCRELLQYFRKYTTEKPSCEEDGLLNYDVTMHKNTHWLLFGENLKAFRSVVLYEHCMMLYLQQIATQLQLKVRAYKEAEC